MMITLKCSFETSTEMRIDQIVIYNLKKKKKKGIGINYSDRSFDVYDNFIAQYLFKLIELLSRFTVTTNCDYENVRK